QAKERPKLSRQGAAQDGQASDEMAESEEFFRGKISIRELIAEKHAHDRSNGKRVQNPGLFAGLEAEARQVAEDQRQARPPDKKLQHHHEEKFETDCLVHGCSATRGSLETSCSFVAELSADSWLECEYTKTVPEWQGFRLFD